MYTVLLMNIHSQSPGFDYYGTETMYSGINGEMMKAEIFIGVVYYQRLRHMVSDKYQVIHNEILSGTFFDIVKSLSA